jgi:hypothetical protein
MNLSLWYRSTPVKQGRDNYLIYQKAGWQQIMKRAIFLIPLVFVAAGCAGASREKWMP